MPTLSSTELARLQELRPRAFHHASQARASLGVEPVVSTHFPYRSLPLLIALSPLLATGCGAAAGPRPADNESEAALYAAAKREGSLVWLAAYYTQDATQALADAFETRYPGVKVTFTRQPAQIVYQRLTQEQQANSQVTDVFSSTDETHYVEQKAKGYLERYRPPNIDQLPLEFRHLDPDDAYQLGAIALVVIDYNSSRAGSGALPHRWLDLLDPSYKGRLSIGDPRFSGYAGNWVVAIIDKYGVDYFRRLSLNQPRVNRSILDPVTQVSAGERDFGVSTVDSSLQKKSVGGPINVVYPDDDAIAIFSPVAILKGAPHPNAARLFENFMYSKTYSETLVKSFNLPLRNDVVPTDGKTLAQIRWYRNSPTRLADGIPQAVDLWRQLFGG